MPTKSAVRGEDAAQRADDEDPGQQENVVSAPESVGQAAADQGADRGTDDQDADDEPFRERRQREVVLQRFESTVDDAGVVAEQQAAERGDDHDDAQSA